MGTPKDFWRSIAILLFGVLTGGAHGYYVVGPSKPTNMEVSEMIVKEAPNAVRDELKELSMIQRSIEIELGKQSVQIKQILEAVK